VGEGGSTLWGQRGIHEGLELRDGDPQRFAGRGVVKAISHIHNMYWSACSDSLMGEIELADSEGVDNKQDSNLDGGK